MQRVTIEEIIQQTISELKNGKVNERVDDFTNYKSDKMFLKGSVVVQVRLKQEGIKADIDITDFFKKEVN